MVYAVGALVVNAFILLLHVLVPGRWVDGYVRDPSTGRPLRYRLNGLLVLACVLATYGGLAGLGVLPWDFFYLHRWEMLAGACVLGFIFTLAIVLGAPVDKPRSLLAEVYLGRRENPQWAGGRLDAKMALYLLGAVVLELNVISFAAHHLLTYAADPSPGVILYAVLFSFFVVEYLFFERVHLYTYDFLAERVGFKLGWGCLVFYPFFYGIGLWAVADRPNPHAPLPLTLGAAALFFVGWSLARGANMQKFFFKTQPDKKAFGLLAPETLGHEDKRVLVSGFWGLSRHINYLGEILMASGLALSLGYPGAVWPWLYPLYYFVLLFPRQYFDDQRCAAKYGELWQEYRRRVRYRIVPGIY